MSGGPAIVATAKIVSVRTQKTANWRKEIPVSFMTASSLLVMELQSINKTLAPRALLTRFLQGRSIFLLLHGRHRSGSGSLLPEPPDGDIAQIQRVPPQVQHRLVQPQDAVARHARRRRNELREPLAHSLPLFALRARQKMPKRQRILFPRLGEDRAQCLASRFRACRSKVERLERLSQRLRRVLKIRRARSGSRPRRAHRSRGNERVAAIQMKTHPAKRGSQQSRTVRPNVQRVRAPQIHR